MCLCAVSPGNVAALQVRYFIFPVMRSIVFPLPLCPSLSSAFRFAVTWHHLRETLGIFPSHSYCICDFIPAKKPKPEPNLSPRFPRKGKEWAEVICWQEFFSCTEIQVKHYSPALVLQFFFFFCSHYSCLYTLNVMFTVMKVHPQAKIHTLLSSLE